MVERPREIVIDHDCQIFQNCTNVEQSFVVAGIAELRLWNRSQTMAIRPEFSRWVFRSEDSQVVPDGESLEDAWLQGESAVGGTVKALSLWQPWASLMYDERKRIETRHWELLYRGPMAIHAAKKVDFEACRDFGYHPLTIPRGAVLCVVGVQGCVRFPHPLAPPDEYGDFEEGRFGILTTMLKKIPVPIPATGHQGLWNWEEV